MRERLSNHLLRTRHARKTENLTQRLTAPDHRHRQTAFGTDNGAPAFVARTAPLPHCRDLPRAGRGVSVGGVEVWRGGCRWNISVAPLSSSGASLARPWLRFHTLLIEPDWRISRNRLSDKTSRLHPRHVVPRPAQAYEPEVPVKLREWIGPAALASPDLVLEAQQPAPFTRDGQQPLNGNDPQNAEGAP